MVLSNTLNSLSLRACRELKTDSWKPAWVLFLLMNNIGGEKVSLTMLLCWDAAVAHLSGSSQSH